jgi:hypothetical protein
MERATLALAILLLAGCKTQEAVRPIPRMDMCQLSRDFRRYDGRLIAVRGVYNGNLGQRCDQKCADGEPWPSHLYLAGTNPQGSGELPVPFTTNNERGELGRTVPRRNEPRSARTQRRRCLGYGHRAASCRVPVAHGSVRPDRRRTLRPPRRFPGRTTTAYSSTQELYEVYRYQSTVLEWQAPGECLLLRQ